MEEFVTNLIKSSDLSILTTKAVRKAYEVHIKQSLDKDEKGKLKQIVSTLLDDIAKNLKAPSPTKPVQIKLSPKKSPTKSVPQNPPPRKSPSKKSETSINSEEGSIDSTDALEIENKSSPSKTTLEEGRKKLLKRKTKIVKSYAESESGDDNETSSQESVSKSSNGKRSSSIECEEGVSEEDYFMSGRRKSENDKVNEDTSDNDSSEGIKSPTKNLKDLAIPRKENSSKTKQGSRESEEADDISANSEQDSGSVCADKVSITSEDNTEVNSTAKKKKSPVKKGKKLSVDDVVEALLDSDKDASSEAVSIEVESEVSSGEEEPVPQNQNKKRKFLSSDDASNGEDEMPLKSRKNVKKSTTKVKQSAKKRRMMTESEDVESETSDNTPLKSSKKSKPVGKKKKKERNLQDEMASSGDEKPSKTTTKVLNSNRKSERKKSRINVFADSSDSDLDDEPLKPKKISTAKPSPSPGNKGKKIKMKDSDDECSGSDSDDEPLRSTTKTSANKKKARKTKKADSDSDDGFSESEDEPLKPALRNTSSTKMNKKSKKQMMNNSDIEVSSDSDNKPLKPSTNSKKKTLVSGNQAAAGDSENEASKPAKKMTKKPKSKTKMKAVNSDESDDNQEVDFEVSSRTKKKKLARSSRSRRGSSNFVEYESESDQASLSSYVSSKGSLSKWNVKDSPSEDSGVNVFSSSRKGTGVSLNYGKASRKMLKSVSDEDEDEDEEMLLNTVSDSLDEAVISKRKSSIFSLSDTDSDKNAKKRELLKAFKQRNIAKLLHGDSFDVKQCVIVLERIDDQINWVTRTANVKDTNRKLSASKFDTSDSDDLSLEEIKSLGKKDKSKSFKSSTPVATKKRRKKSSRTIAELESDSDGHDVPLIMIKNTEPHRKKSGTHLQPDSNSDLSDVPLKPAKSGTKVKSKKKVNRKDFNSTFEHDDTYFQGFKKKRKEKGKTLDSTFDSDDLPLKPLRKGNRKVLVDSESLSISCKSLSTISTVSKQKVSKKKNLQSGAVRIKRDANKSLRTSSISDSEEESLASLKRSKKLENSATESSQINTESSADAEVVLLPTRVSPRKLVSRCHDTPSKSTRSHDKTPVKPNTPSADLHIVSESEEGSDVGSLNDSIRSLEMLNPQRRESLLLNRRAKVITDKQTSEKTGSRRSLSTSPKKSVSKTRGVCESDSDSDASSIIEPLVSLSAVSSSIKDGVFDSDMSSVNGKEAKEELSEADDVSKVSSTVESHAAPEALDSDDSGTSMEITASPEPVKKKGKNKAPQSKGQGRLANLRKICHCAGIILRNKIELLGCDTDQEKITRILEILRSKGMKGQPSMNKAKILKLKKEASELDKDNIISDTGRSRRKVKSLFNRGGNSPSPSPKKVPPLRLKLSRLQGIVDSEGSGSD